MSTEPALVAGSDGGAEHWATIASLIETCKINDNRSARPSDRSPTRIVNGHPNRDIDALLLWAFKTHDRTTRGLKTSLTKWRHRSIDQLLPWGTDSMTSKSWLQTENDAYCLMTLSLPAPTQFGPTSKRSRTRSRQGVDPALPVSNSR